MIIERICLEDFGIFRNQIMEDIHPRLVVIAGGNRAGKTTLMTALRYLGYGLPKIPFLPPCSGPQHVLSADARLHDGSKYTIQLTGYGAPKVSPLNRSRELSIEEIYNKLDRYTYRQVFTISLDELRRIPEGTSSTEEQHLQAVLLGGGWTDALRLMQIRKEFGKEANDIGGKKGSKTVGQFKPYSKSIKEGIDLRDEANSQLEEFYRLKDEISSNKKRLSVLTEHLEEREKQLGLFELLRDHFDVNSQIRQLEEEMAAPENRELLEDFPADGLSRSERLLVQYRQVEDRHKLLCSQFDAAVGLDRLDPLILNGKILDTYEKQLSGWRQGTASLSESLRDHKKEYNDLAVDLRNLKTDWGTNPAQLNQVNLDMINEKHLLSQVSAHREKVQSLENCRSQIKETQEILDLKKEQAEGAETKQGFPKSLFLFAAAGLVAVLLSAVLFDPLTALSSGVVTGAGIIAYLLYKTLGAKESRRDFLAEQIQELEDKLRLLEKKKSNLEKELAESTQLLEHLLEKANLPRDLEHKDIPDFIIKVQDLKRRYNQWLYKDEALKKQETQQNKVVTGLEKLLTGIGLAPVKGAGETSNPNILYDAVENACTYLQSARDLKANLTEKEDLEKDIRCLLSEKNTSINDFEWSPEDYIEALNDFTNRGQRYEELQKKRQDLNALKSGLTRTLATPRNRTLLDVPEDTQDSELPRIFNALCSPFSSREELEEKCTNLQSERQKLSDEIEQIKREIPAQEKQLTDLASEEKLIKANQIITEARHQLEEKAEEYAVNRLAEHLVARAYSQLLEETKGAVLGNAGKLLGKITSGEYSAVDLAEEGEEQDFVAVPSGSKKGLKTPALSRGTREQLFLSVRLSRIQAIEPPLPVIMDDSMANFDPSHTRQAMEILAQLSETHQVFLLTCHPELLECIRDIGCPAQYWSLDRGKINRSQTPLVSI
ncbi:MAG TPA: AAA family ATPase [Clostridia bacterium]|nr:AAA family ATPase [Clostridia bacterium]